MDLTTGGVVGFWRGYECHFRSSGKRRWETVYHNIPPIPSTTYPTWYGRHSRFGRLTAVRLSQLDSPTTTEHDIWTAKSEGIHEMYCECVRLGVGQVLDRRQELWDSFKGG